MRVRLGFAVAAHLEPEILVVDEVLAVGDAEFQKKAIGKMKEVSANKGRTVLFVSHNLSSLRRLCTRGILIENGMMTFQSDIESTIKAYNESGMNGGIRQEASIEWTGSYPGSHEFQLHSVRIGSSNEFKNVFSSNEEIQVTCQVRIVENIRNFRFNIQILTQEEEVLFTSTSHNAEPGNKEAGDYTYLIGLPKDFFNRGTYKIRLISDVNKQRIVLFPIDVLEFQITESLSINTFSLDYLPGLTSPKILWHFEKK